MAEWGLLEPDGGKQRSDRSSRRYSNFEPLSSKGAIMTRLLSRKETSTYLRIGETTLWRLTNTGELPSIQIGSRRLYREEDLANFVISKVQRV